MGPIQDSDAPHLRHIWRFPLTRTHTGVLLGNGTLGAMVWGEGNVLRITVGRADWWDHRGSRQWTEEMSFTAIRRLLEADDEQGIRTLFSDAPKQAGFPRRASVLPVGRLELIFPENMKLSTAVLDMGIGEIAVFATDKTDKLLPLGTFDIEPHSHVLRLRLATNVPRPSVVCVPSWEHVGDYLRSIAFCEPEIKPDGSGWTQQTPAPDDANLTLRHAFVGPDEWRVSVALDHDENDDIPDPLMVSFEGRATWWRDYWRRVPHVNIPISNWNFLYHYGLYKFAGLTAPQGVAATLQGPWIEEYQMPPWSSDYHFNINVQMCYSPAFQSGLWDHLTPLFSMIERWLPTLRQNAQKFVGIDDGYLLPHAVDDRGGIIGTFWTGTIDHACTVWISKMMFDYYDYSGDIAFLRRLAYPFMCGAMKVYEAMLDRLPDGSLSMPISVSPEYRGASMNAWGCNASFQLAACHWLAGALETAAATLGKAPDPNWLHIRKKLPQTSLWPPCKATVCGEEKGDNSQSIALWEGQLPDESHRHHSHLAGFCPFDILDPDDPRIRPIATNSARQWIGLGMGKWSGWSMPWAAMLHTRFGNAEMPELIIDLWQRIFTNEGHGTLHDATLPGFTLMGAPGMSAHSTNGEIMQMEAGMAITAAIMDALVHVRGGVIHLFAGISKCHQDCHFENIRVAGGFQMSAIRKSGKVVSVRVQASRAGECVIASPWNVQGETLNRITLNLTGGEVRIISDDNCEIR